MQTEPSYFTDKMLEMSLESATDFENNFKILGDMTTGVVENLSSGIADFFAKLAQFDIAGMTDAVVKSFNDNIGAVNSAVTSAGTGPIQYTVCKIIEEKFFSCKGLTDKDYMYCVNGFRAVLSRDMDPESQI